MEATRTQDAGDGNLTAKHCEQSKHVFTQWASSRTPTLHVKKTHTMPFHNLGCIFHIFFEPVKEMRLDWHSFGTCLEPQQHMALLHWPVLTAATTQLLLWKGHCCSSHPNPLRTSILSYYEGWLDVRGLASTGGAAAFERGWEGSSINLCVCVLISIASYNNMLGFKYLAWPFSSPLDGCQHWMCWKGGWEAGKLWGGVPAFNGVCLWSIYGLSPSMAYLYS